MTVTDRSPVELRDPDLLRTDLYINGEWRQADSGGRFEVKNPATGETVAAVADAGESETRAAIEAADAAFARWRDLTAKQRSALLRSWFELVVENADDLGLLITKEMGKPLPEARGEIIFGANYIEWYAEEAKRAYGEIIPTHNTDMRLLVVKQPIGVVAAITPWNFPSSTITRKVAPAMAAGCPVVVKPAEDTPLSALALAELADRAGIPPGVFNVVTARDPAPVGRELTTNPTVRKVSFTGSTEVGKLLMRQSSSTVKQVALELGGNAPFIVFDDADLDEAVPGAMISKYRNGGQTCICANRIFVQDGVFDEFADRLAADAEGLVVGDGMAEGSDVGPLINDQQFGKVIRLVEDAVSGGATVITGGGPHDLGGTFYQPTVLTDVSMDMAVAIEEIFGPVAVLYRFSTEEEAIQLANDTPYGLAAYFYARDMGRIWRVSEGLDYGMVGINTGLLMIETAPFGGVKESGMGREGAHDGLEEYLEAKYLAMGGVNG